MSVRCFMVVQDDEHLWRRVEGDDGTRWKHFELPAGAMWDANWFPPEWGRGGDGRYLCVKLPDGGEWAIDGQSSNCSRKGEDHDCWCRHGDPPRLTVDKNPEPGRTTCVAGAGSIVSQYGWHGFLRDGEFVEV